MVDHLVCVHGGGRHSKPLPSFLNGWVINGLNINAVFVQQLVRHLFTLEWISNEDGDDVTLRKHNGEIFVH